MDNQDEIKQLKIKKYYDESSYYENVKHNYAYTKSKFNQYMIYNVLKIYHPTKKEKIIEIGCGWGNISLSLQKEGLDVIGLDYSKKSIEICKQSAIKLGLDETKFLCREATDTKLDPNSIDVVYCADLVEHLYPNVYLKLLKEVHRILKTDGKLVIYTPNPSHFIEIIKKHNIILKKDITHVDYKTMERLKKSLSNAGFVISKSYYIESHHFFLKIIEKTFMKFVSFLRRRNAVLAIKK